MFICFQRVKTWKQIVPSTNDYMFLACEAMHANCAVYQLLNEFINLANLNEKLRLLFNYNNFAIVDNLYINQTYIIYFLRWPVGPTWTISNTAIRFWFDKTWFSFFDHKLWKGLPRFQWDRKTWWKTKGNGYILVFIEICFRRWY